VPNVIWLGGEDVLRAREVVFGPAGDFGARLLRRFPVEVPNDVAVVTRPLHANAVVREGQLTPGHGVDTA